MSNRNVKLGAKENSVRHDGKVNVWQYLIDPSLTADELQWYKKIDYVPGRWQIVDVRSQY